MGLDNQARLRTELAAILTQGGLCREGSVCIRLRNKRPDEEASALGAARVQDGRVLPEPVLFVNAIAEVIDTRLPGVLGRAMARAAAHEIAHYLYQDRAHSGRGLLAECLTAGHLPAADRRFFRLAPPGPRD